METHTSKERISSSLWKELETVSQKCINCKLCQKECEFLRRYGKPKEIADSYNPGDKKHQAMPFECSLCRLCAAVCPMKIDPSDMFLEMRREAVRRGNGDYPEQAGILGYEKRGTSKRYTYYALPAGCDAVFFPGCALSGTRPDKVIKLYEHMKKTVPSLGIVLDCCTKPSHDLGRAKYFNSMFSEMKDFLTDNRVKNILVACPSCYEVFRKYGEKLSVKTVYEFMAENGLPETGKIEGVIAIHDPCAMRFEESVHSAIRNIAANKNLIVNEMPHAREKTFCCGEGGSAGLLSPDLAGNWRLLRKKETNGNRILTYCAGCANYLNSVTPTGHIVDLIFEPEITLAGREKVAKAPLTYMNRLKLKKHFQKSVHAPVTRERTFSAVKDTGSKGFLKRSLTLLFIIAAILAARFTGITNYLEQDALRQWIEGYGILAPVVYMLIYTIAPALFLPGMPITIAGGILFGPFWGVIYTITSATLGACVAFLVSRYIARDWINKKLRSPKWRRLDEGVVNHGWKIVAFTRLIPLFPFNLLNYAFGLTKINFWHYAITSFICMLPACIAFIVFSSSFLDLLKGEISPMFIIGFGLTVIVSLIPVFYRKYKTKKGLTDPV